MAARAAAIGVLAAGGAVGITTAADAHGRHATVTDLQVDGRADNPLGVDDTRPALSWRTRGGAQGWAQSAYRIRAARDRDDLMGGRYLWDSGRVRSGEQTDIDWEGRELRSRESVIWQVKVWSSSGHATSWSQPATWEMGLLEPGDWGGARWIEHAGRRLEDPLPIFARAFRADRGGREAGIAKARLYLSGIGIHHAELNGRPVTDEVLAPGNSNFQLSTEYRTYDVTRLLRTGANTVGVELGHGTALVTRSVTNPAAGRTSPYSWWQSQSKGSGALAAPAAAGDTAVKVSDAGGYHLGGTINIDTSDGGDRLESREITAIGTPGPNGTGISFKGGLGSSHAAGAAVTGSGNPLASTDPSAGAAVSPE